MTTDHPAWQLLGGLSLAWVKALLWRCWDGATPRHDRVLRRML